MAPPQTPPTPIHIPDPHHRDGVLYHPHAYDAFSTIVFLGQRRRIWDKLVTASGATPGQDVLDVGCGTGQFTAALAPAVTPGGSVTGLDPSAPMIDYCRRRHTDDHLRFEIGTAENLPFDDHTFDLVVSSLAIHHIPADHRATAVREMFHVLRPGGRLLLADLRPPDNPIMRRILTTGSGHRRLGPDPIHELRHLVVRAGFVITGTGRHQYMHHIAATRPAA